MARGESNLLVSRIETAGDALTIYRTMEDRVNTLNREIQESIDKLVRAIEDAAPPCSPGSVTIRRDARGNVTMSYRVVRYIPIND